MIFLNHLKVVAKFGRFPHRNEIMGRKTTKEENNFLNDKSFRFDLPLHYTPDGRVVFEETEEFSAKAQGGSTPATPTAAPAAAPAPAAPTAMEMQKDSAEVKMCLLSRIAQWRDTLEAKFKDSDKVIAEKSGKTAVMETTAPQTYIGKDECTDIEFGNKDEDASATTNGTSADAEPVQWTRSTQSQRQTRKSMMAQLLAPAS